MKLSPLVSKVGGKYIPRGIEVAIKPLLASAVYDGLQVKTLHLGHRRELVNNNLKNKMLITKEIEIDMAHRVPNHKSKCQNLHGHRYKIEVGVDDNLVATAGASDEGMVIDFSDLKEIMMAELDGKFDHNSIFYEEDLIRGYLESENGSTSINNLQNKKVHYVSFIPTAENLAKHWYELMKPRLQERGIKIAHVKVWETPTSTATYQE